MSDGSRRYARVCLSLFLGVTMLLGFVTVPAMAEMAEQPEGQLGYEGDGNGGKKDAGLPDTEQDDGDMGEDPIGTAQPVADDSTSPDDHADTAAATGEIVGEDNSMVTQQSTTNYVNVTFGKWFSRNLKVSKIESPYEDDLCMTLSKSGRVTIDFVATANGFDCRLYGPDSLYRYTDLTYDASINKYRVQKHYDLTAGEYIIVCRNGRSDCTYSGTISFTDSQETYPEPSGGNNNTRAEADSITLGKTYRGQIAENDKDDYYVFELSSPRTITVKGETASQKMRVTLRSDWKGTDLSTTWYEQFGKATFQETFELSAGVHYLYFYTSGSGTGPYSFTVYDGYPSVDMANCTATLPNKTMEYTGGRLYNKPSVYAGSRLLKEGTDYTLSYANCVNVGNATVTIKGAGKNTGTRTLTYQITRAPISKVELVDAIPTQWFSGSPCTPGAKLRYNGYDLVKGKDYKIGWSKNTGTTDTGYVTVWGIGNFSGERTFPFKVRVKSTLGPGDPFPDVKPGAWYYNVVNEAAALGLVQGYANGNFGPNAKITRAQVAIILWRMAGEPSVGSGAKSFRDVRHGAYYYVPVRWASSVGVVSGYGNTGFFGPDDPVTREQLAVMLANYMRNVGGRPTNGGYSNFARMSDARKVSSWARNAVGWCFNMYILTGTRDGRINPQGNATRAEAAKMILSVYKLIYY